MKESITARKLNDILDRLDKLDRIERRLEVIEKQHKKRGLSFQASIPPYHVCIDVVKADKSVYDDVMQILSDYYGIPTMGNYHDANKVPPKAIACYHPNLLSAYYKEQGVPLDTVLHEFFHHLVAQGVVQVSQSEVEEKANRYAQLIQQIGSGG